MPPGWEEPPRSTIERAPQAQNTRPRRSQPSSSGLRRRAEKFVLSAQARAAAAKVASSMMAGQGTAIHSSFALGTSRAGPRRSARDRLGAVHPQAPYVGLPAQHRPSVLVIQRLPLGVVTPSALRARVIFLSESPPVV